MEGSIKYKIPKGLPLAVSKDKPLRKAIASLIVLKAQYINRGQINHSELDKAAAYCRVSPKTLQRRIDLLISVGLMYDEHDKYFFSNWDTIRRHFNIDSNKFHYVRDTGIDVVDILEALAMRTPVDNQTKAYYNWVKYTPGLREELAQVTGSTHTAAAVLESQLHCFITEGKGYTQSQIDILGIVGADFSVNTYYYNEMFNYRGIGSMAYKKRKLAKLGLIEYSHRVYPLDGHTTRMSRKTQLGDIIHPTRGGQSKAVLIMPDKIIFHSPSQPVPMKDKI